jgi:DNA-binding response OmpR family regulator
LGDLTLDLGRRELVVGNQAPVTLTALEARLLDFLTSNPGQVMTTESIIDYVWGPHGADRDMVRQLVHRLRLKIEPDPNNPEYIETVAGLGYGFLKSNEIN